MGAPKRKLKVTRNEDGEVFIFKGLKDAATALRFDWRTIKRALNRPFDPLNREDSPYQFEYYEEEPLVTIVPVGNWNTDIPVQHFPSHVKARQALKCGKGTYERRSAMYRQGLIPYGEPLVSDPIMTEEGPMAICVNKPVERDLANRYKRIKTMRKEDDE